jgi:lactate dehydrogenase-like 2-hydroxyacid dehydrogenase
MAGENFLMRPSIFLTQALPDPLMQELKRLYRLEVSVENAQALIITPQERLDAASIAGLPAKLGLIACYSVGVDHVDLAAAKARHIAVTHTPDVLTAATADLTLLLMLAASRRAGEGERALRQRLWQGWAPTYLLGHDLADKCLGIFGMGRIGIAVAHRARAFGLHIHYRHPRPLDESLIGKAYYHAQDETFLERADILSLHAPATAQTFHWLNKSRLAQLPAGAIIINTARGSLVDDDALIEALSTHRLFAAGLDVYAGEPQIHPGYLALENVVLLPHLGSATHETRLAMGRCVLKNLAAYFAGQDLPNPVILR